MSDLEALAVLQRAYAKYKKEFVSVVVDELTFYALWQPFLNEGKKPTEHFLDDDGYVMPDVIGQKQSINLLLVTLGDGLTASIFSRPGEQAFAFRVAQTGVKDFISYFVVKDGLE